MNLPNNARIPQIIQGVKDIGGEGLVTDMKAKMINALDVAKQGENALIADFKKDIVVAASSKGANVTEENTFKEIASAIERIPVGYKSEGTFTVNQNNFVDKTIQLDFKPKIVYVLSKDSIASDFSVYQVGLDMLGVWQTYVTNQTQTNVSLIGEKTVNIKNSTGTLGYNTEFKWYAFA